MGWVLEELFVMYERLVIRMSLVLLSRAARLSEQTYNLTRSEYAYFMYSNKGCVEQISRVHQRVPTIPERSGEAYTQNVRGTTRTSGPLGPLWNMGSRLTRRHPMLLSKAQASGTQ